MRIRTITGLAFAGVAAAAAVAVGGAAYAGGDAETNPVVRIVTEDEGIRAGTADDGVRGSSQRNCPEKGGSGRGESGVPATPEQPATPQESL